METIRTVISVGCLCRVGLVEFVHSEDNIKQSNFLIFSNAGHSPAANLLVAIIALSQGMKKCNHNHFGY